MLKPVVFLKHHSLYNAGEIAGFSEEEAAALVAAKIARPYEAPAAEGGLGDVSASDFEKELASMTKAQLVTKAKEDFNLNLSERSSKDDLVATIVAAVAEQEAQSNNGSGDVVDDKPADGVVADDTQKAAE